MGLLKKLQRSAMNAVHLPVDWKHGLQDFIVKGHSFLSLPFNCTGLEVEVISQPWRLLLIKTILMFSTLDTCYRLLVCIFCNRFPEVQLTNNDVLIMVTDLVTRAGCTLIGWDVLILRATYAYFCNILLSNEPISSSHIPKRDKMLGRGSLYWFIVLCTWLCLIFPISAPLSAHLQERHSIRYWGAVLLPQGIYDDVLGASLYVILELMIVFSNIFLVVFASSCLLAYSMLTLSSIHELVLKTKRVELGHYHYRRLQIMNGICNECMSTSWLFGQATVLLSQVVVNITIIRTHRSVPWVSLVVLSLILMYFEKCCIKACATIYEESVKFKGLLNRGRRKRESAMISRSIKPISVQVGSSFFFKMSTFNRYMATMVECTWNVLIASKQN